MAGKISVEALLERNREIAATHQPFPTFKERAAGGIPLPQLLIITCVDPRCDPTYFLGIKPGGMQPPFFSQQDMHVANALAEGVLVIRNVCGHVLPDMGSILALDSLVTLTAIMIIHEADCGAINHTDDMIRDSVKARLGEVGVKETRELDEMAFGCITDIRGSVADDLALLKSSPYIRKELAEKTVGYVYDIKTGLLNPVE